jgi:hypothetical protein
VLTWRARQKTCEGMFTHLMNLEFIRAEVFRGLASEATESDAPVRSRAPLTVRGPHR